METTWLNVRPSSSDRASTALPRLLRSSVSGQFRSGLTAGRISGSSGDGLRGFGFEQWLVQKNAYSVPPMLTPPEGTLKKPCFTTVGPTILAGANFLAGV